MQLPFDSSIAAVTLSACLVVACASNADPNPAPDPVDAPSATHSGLLSIQEASIARMPEVGRGLSVRLELSAAARAPDFEALAGPLGCRAWLYDVETDPPPARSGDEGAIVIRGTEESLSEPCVFTQAQGYVCPVGEWDLAGASMKPGRDGRAVLEVPGAAFTQELAQGRYLWLQGPGATDGGRFPILAIPSATSLLVHAPGVSADTGAMGTATVLAGAGPVPNNPRNPIRGGEQVSLGIEPRSDGHFFFEELTVIAGEEFQPDDATVDLMTNFPVGGAAVTLSCSGVGGRCGNAAVSALSIATTDADVADLSPLAFPAPRKKQVSVLCALEGGDGSIAIPEKVMELLATADAEAPITRIRVAYMRDGIAFGQNAPGTPPNPVSMLVGHQVLAFATPRR